MKLVNHGIYDIKYIDKAGKEAIIQKTIPDAYILKAGDYIKYDTGVTTVGDNGVVMFRVLYSMDSKYGLQIISDKNIQDVTLGGSTWEEGKKAYNGAIETLNNEAGKYVNREYAYDGRCVGSIPTVKNRVFVDKNKFKNSEGKVPGTVLIPDAFTIPNAWNGNKDTGCYGEDSHYLADLKALESTMSSIGQNYWLASRFVWMDSSNISFNVRAVDTNGSEMGTPICYVASHGLIDADSYTYGLRACISLKANEIKITGGDGKSEATAYTIGK